MKEANQTYVGIDISKDTLDVGPGRGWMRELQGRWPESWGRWEAGGRSSVAHRAPKALCGSCDARDGERIRSRGSRRGREVAGWPSGRERALQPGQGATELGFKDLQGEAARRAGDITRAKDPPPEGRSARPDQSAPSSGPGCAPSPVPPARRRWPKRPEGDG